MAWNWVEDRAVATPSKVLLLSVTVSVIWMALGVVLCLTTSPVFVLFALAALPSFGLDVYLLRLQRR